MIYTTANSEMRLPHAPKAGKHISNFGLYIPFRSVLEMEPFALYGRLGRGSGSLDTLESVSSQNLLVAQHDPGRPFAETGTLGNSG